MATPYYFCWWGRQGLELRTPHVRRTIAPQGWGPDAQGSYPSQAQLEAAESGRMLAEFVIDKGGPVCLRFLDSYLDFFDLLGDPQPTFKLYRLPPPPAHGAETLVRWGVAERLLAVTEPFDEAAAWTLAMTRKSGVSLDALDNAAAFALAFARKVGATEESILAAGWELDPNTLPPTGPAEPPPPASDPDPNTPPGPLTVPADTDAQLRGGLEAAIADGADVADIAGLVADWAAADVFRDAVRWWQNSRGPYRRITTTTPPRIGRWYTLRQRYAGEQNTAPLGPELDRALGGGAGALIYRSVSLVASYLETYADLPRIQDAWTLFAVLRPSALDSDQQNAVGLGAPGGKLCVLQTGTDAGNGIGVALGTEGGEANQYWDTAADTEALCIVEIAKEADAPLSAWLALRDGQALGIASQSNDGFAPQWTFNHLRTGVGWAGVPGVDFAGDIAEVILLATADAAIRGAARNYLATKFGISLL